MMPGFFAKRIGAAGGTLQDEILADSPFAYWQLGEAAAPVSYADSSGNGYHLTNVVPTVTSGLAGLVVPGSCTEFNGSSGYIGTQNNEFGPVMQATFGGDQPFTIVAVINIDNFAGNPLIVHFGTLQTNPAQGFFLFFLPDGKLRLQFILAGVGFAVLDSAAPLNTGQTYIVHARRAAGGSTQIFVDGVFNATGAFGGSVGMDATAASGGTRMNLGATSATPPAAFMDGKMQHVAVFASALDDTRIAAHAAAAGF